MLGLLLEKARTDAAVIAGLNEQFALVGPVAGISSLKWERVGFGFQYHR
jgi:hypothetical protein